MKATRIKQAALTALFGALAVVLQAAPVLAAAKQGMDLGNHNETLIRDPR